MVNTTTKNRTVTIKVHTQTNKSANALALFLKEQAEVWLHQESLQKISLKH